jgi:outer membrane receptor protein involved in Fe transport
MQWLAQQVISRSLGAIDSDPNTGKYGKGTGMIANQKVARAIAAILSASAVGLHVAPAAAADEATDSGGIQQITVTAQRREESAQDVPITIQAITGAQLGQLQVTTMDDVIKYLPNVTLGQNGPGQGNIFMRGLSSGFQGNQSSATIAQFPNVAAYLDDQSMQFPNHNLDIYMVDMERIEVLEGPQGTLFGGGAEAGLVRYITNKPKLDKTEGNAEASYGTTAGGDNNSSLNATLNLPIIPGTFALRGVIYNDRRGGYIDNVASTFTRQNNDSGNFYGGIVPPCPNGKPSSTGYCVPANSPVVNNNSLAQTNENPVTYIGTRVSGLYQINDDWNVLVAQSYQNMEADGEFMQYPVGSEGQALGPDQITQFSPAYDKDRYENTAWTVNGAFGDFKAVYTGGYLVRHIEQTEDYTNYARSAEGFYYSCTGGTGLGPGTTPTCYSPITSWHDTVRNTHLSHELRVSTPENWFVRALAGAYYEDFKIQDVMNFLYKTVPSCTPDNLAAAQAGGLPCLANVRTAAGTTATDPGVRNDNTAFGEDAQRGYKQTALFASADYDLIPKVLTITGGTRWYHYTEFETGSVYATGNSCLNVPNGECTGGMTNINGENLRASYRGFRSRGNITWHITPDAMAYFTFSQGFRPGAFNRSQRDKANILDTTTGNVVPQFKTPAGYAPDSLTNYEVGLKTEFLDHRVQVNLSAYHMIWKDVQLLFYNPIALGNTTFGITGPQYNVDGVELQFTARATQGLTLMGSASYNRAKQKSSPCLMSNEPSSPTLGQCITQTYDPGTKTNVAFQNPFGALDTTPAFSPELEFNARARYDWSFNEYETFVMVGANHVGSMSNQPATYKDGNLPSEAIPDTTFLRYTQPAYTTYDASLGVSKDNWNVQVFGNNLSNSNASVFTSSAQFIKSEVPLRPRVLGAKIGFKF